ncbi:MAG: hypothetical protein HOP02_01405 [Methylococcaceae bacterium]|nr:hypothetical protein [Methylococcaceae bacterium]
MIKTTRVVFLSITIFLYVILTGFDAPSNDAKSTPNVAENLGIPEITDLEQPPNLATPLESSLQKNAVIESKQTPTGQIGSVVKQSSQIDKKSVNKPLDLKTTPVIVNNDLQQSLNLSIPFESDLPADQNSAAQNQKSNIFAPDATKKPQSIRLDGNVLMTQELEAEKRKTLDGAGISINLKP